MSHSALRLSVVILCKNEEATIAGCLQQISEQDVFDRPNLSAEIVVVANGCDDRTASAAEAFGEKLAGRDNLRLKVLDLPQGGKSRSWNRAVHEFTDPACDYMLFLDSDVELIDVAVFSRLLDHLAEDGGIAVHSGYPLKAVARKTDPGILDRFSLLVSRNTRHLDAICGQLYVIRADEARQIWLPDDTPGEDGFLNAMVNTSGFSCARTDLRVFQARQPTHYFEAHSPADFFVHERRMFVGTIINRWMFEYLWSLNLSEPAGPRIRDLNGQGGDWIQDIINRNIGTRRWLIPHEMVFGRFRSPRTIGWGRFFARLPMAIAATILTIPPAIMANQTLKRKGAATHW